MSSVFHFPDVGEGIHEGRVVEWLVAEGTAVAEDEALVKVETDKAVVELPSPHAGIVLKIHAAAEATIEVGDPLVTIGEAGEEAPEAASDEGSESENAGELPSEHGVVAPAVPEAAAGSIRRPLATPRTRVLARKLGVELVTIHGSGPGGRITDEDVERAARGETAPGVPRVAAPGQQPVGRAELTIDGEVERVPISHLRKVIANAMRASKHTAAHVTHVDEADVTNLMSDYRRLKEAVEAKTGVKFSLLPFFIKALVTVLKKYPMFNASVDEQAEEILLKRYYNIGIAVDTPQGLIVPVVKDADTKDMVELAREVADLAARARSRELSLDELKGGSCTITNIGPLGGVFATPIINQPELAIVGLHKIQDRAVVVDGEIAIRQMMYLSVSFDHRYIDGADGARFMTDLVELVSEPGLLMVRL
jgi:pyruvate dehydrogenase E2 component (dihydrolipoamide acetyltransferase)